MEHELRIDGKILRESEGLGLVLSVLCKLLAQTNQHAVQPAENIWAIVNLGLEMMGWDTMQKIAAENDCRAHLSSAFSKFFNDGKELGFKEALRRRDEPYGDLTGDHRTDSVVKLNILNREK